MRKALDALYGAALFGACSAMVLIATLVFIQVVARLIDRLSTLAGLGRFGFAIPSLAEIGGFLFVASAFLALPATLRAAGHVRVTLFVGWAGPRLERAMTAFVLIIALALAAYASWVVGGQAYASFERASVSYGLIAIPLWIPQAVMTTGLAILSIAILDELAAVLSGGEARFREIERTRGVDEGGH